MGTVGGVKAMIILLVVVLVGCTTPFTGFDLTDPNQAKIEEAVREELDKPIGKPTESDLEKVTELGLRDNPGFTKAQIAELQKALPKCEILSNAKK